MVDPHSSPIGGRRREAAETLLARNLVAVRTAAGWTQDALSAASGISRATIAQLETGVSDPRLSTLAALATAARLPLAFLLVGEAEVRALAGLAARLSSVPVTVPPRDMRQLNRWVNSGMLRDRADAVRLAADRVGAVDGLQPLAVVLAALFTTFVPDPGLAIGAAWGELIATDSVTPDPTSGDADRPKP